MSTARHILPVIVFAQFLGTSLWFASNAVLGNIQQDFQLGDTALGHLTSAVQLGFILGTLVFAILTVADRFSPSKVFFLCAVFGSLGNLGMIWQGNSMASLLLLRIFTGICLAGIYPVGMKLAADHFEKGLGKSLGYLVGALVLGTALPHFLNFTSGLGALPWRAVVAATSALACTGGLLVLVFVPDGPFRKPNPEFDPRGIIHVFKDRDFRVAAFGYFGHMWELYAFWAFVPVILSFRLTDSYAPNSLWSFIIIGLGGLACVIGGYIAHHKGSKPIATTALFCSGLCCLLSPLVFSYAPDTFFLLFLCFWGMVVIADSPLFSTMVAQNAIPEFKGSALTIVNCIGFSITIFSIQLLSWLQLQIPTPLLLLPLAAGPILGLYFLFKRAI